MSEWVRVVGVYEVSFFRSLNGEGARACGDFCDCGPTGEF